MGKEIGLATVYRVLKTSLRDAGIVTRHNFEGSKSGLFELAQQHHTRSPDLLDCGKVIEFSDDSIESRQREIAARHGYPPDEPQPVPVWSR